MSTAADDDRAPPEKETAAQPLQGPTAGVSNNTNSVAHPAVLVEVPRTAAEFVRVVQGLLGTCVVQFLHKDAKRLEKEARKRGINEPWQHEDYKHLYIEYGNARCFPGKTDLRAWLQHTEGEEWNSYWLPSSRRRPVGNGSRANSKPRKAHIAGVRILWVDVDPASPPVGCEDADAWIAKERKRILRLFGDERPADVPAPHFVIDSGGGYQAFWILDEEFRIDPEHRKGDDGGDEYLIEGVWVRDDDTRKWMRTPKRERASMKPGPAQAYRERRIAEIERYTGALAERFGGDAPTRNVDRVMRLPFTWNNPDEVKVREKGRKRAPTGIVSWNIGRRYSLAEMPRVEVAPAQADDRGDRPKTMLQGAGPAAKLPTGDLMAYLADKQFEVHHQPLLDELAAWTPDLAGGAWLADGQLEKLSERTQELLLYGALFRDCTIDERFGMAPLPQILREDANGNRQWVKLDRNGQSLAFAVAALEDRLPPSLIAGLLVNSFCGISTHCLDQGNPVRAAVRTVGEAIGRIPAPESRPAIQVPQDSNDDAAFARELGPVLSKKDFYVRGDAVAVLSGQRLRILKPEEAVTEFQCAALYYKVTEDGDRVRARLNLTATRIALASHIVRDALPEVRLITDVPVLRADGTVRSGYHDGVLSFGKQPEDVPFDEAKRLVLDVLLKDFKPATDGDRARMVAALLTPALLFGGLLGKDRVPATLVEADDSQTGKGYFVRLKLALYGIARPHVITQRPKGVGSIEEDISEGLMQATPIIVFDNWRGRLDSPALESLLTEDSYLCRVPHKPPTRVDPRSTAVDVTTNGAELPRDMANRLNPCRLRKQEQDYKFQSFPEGDLLAHVAANQSRYLGALYSILREWLRRGALLTDSAGGHDFNKWARAVRWICKELLGIGDPMSDLVEIKQRLASPGGSWLREACLALKRLGHVGTSMTPLQMAKALAGHVPVPGKAADEDLEDDSVALKAARAVGSRLAGCFRAVEADGPEQRLRVEDLVLFRVSVPDESDSSKTARLYRLEKYEPPF